MSVACRPSVRIAAFAVAILGLGLSLFHLYTAAFGTYAALLQRSVHLALTAGLGFLGYSFAGRRRKDGESPGWTDWGLAALALVVFGTIAVRYKSIEVRQALVDALSAWDMVVGALGIALVLELTRRVAGIVLTLIGAAFLAYALAGPYVPGVFAHRGFGLVDVVDYQMFGLNGIFGIPLGVSATYVVLFIILGTIMEESGTGAVLMDMGRRVAGRFRGGPAKIAVLTSAMFGTISGSAVANVYSTGVVTIPMMKRIGYAPHFAGAVEAAASTGGQIMPPIMGAAAFLIADILAIPYLEVCKAAAIPAILFYLGLLLMVDFEAARTGLRGLAPADLPSWSGIGKRAHLLLPVGVLLYVLVRGYTPFWAAFVGVASAVVVSALAPSTRLSPRALARAMIVSAQRTVVVAVGCAVAGVIVGVVTLTGVGLNLSAMVLSVAQGRLLPALLLIMVASLIMGMGTPTTVAYIIVATLGVPVLEKIGVASLPSHMFVFYFGVISMVTPPVAVAAFAAADIAGDSMWRVGWTATKLALVAFLIPFMFVLDQGLLLRGPWLNILGVTLSAGIGVVGLAAGLVGWLFRPVGWFVRVLLIVSALLLIVPGVRTDLVGLAMLFVLGGVGLVGKRATAEPGAARTTGS
ncbi:MAG: TRAP transporter fused permease subunit [Zetaproteobacteria bacterium]|nr:MAG: TRAP transporter fused permease subunit [Zetaproteobacteria bacterium]